MKGTGRSDEFLRSVVSDFVSMKIVQRDTPALVWVLQRAAAGLLLVDVEPDRIRAWVDAALPSRKE